MRIITKKESLGIGDKIKQERKCRGISGKKLAKILNMSERTYYKYERYDDHITLALLKQISEALHCPIEDLFTEPKDIEFEFCGTIRLKKKEEYK